MLRELRLKGYIAFMVLFAVGYLFATAQKYFMPEIILLRTAALLVVCVVLFTAFFLIVKPADPVRLSKAMSLLLGALVAVIIVIQHLVITFTPSIKNLIVLVVSVIVPFISGLLYEILKGVKEKGNSHRG